MKKSSGQAMMEFLLFLPVMIFLLAVLFRVAAAINASINQQKIVRGYFYNIVQHDSKIPTLQVLPQVATEGVVQTGMFALGWRNKTEGELQLAPCFKMMPFSNDPFEEVCSPGNKGQNGPTTQFIRVKTVYGVCASTYSVFGNFFIESNNLVLLPPSAAVSGCLSPAN